MLIAAIKSIFDIDNVGSRWGVRILYLVTVVLNAAIHFNPWADTDFTPLQSWAMDVYNLTEYDAERVLGFVFYLVCALECINAGIFQSACTACFEVFVVEALHGFVIKTGYLRIFVFKLTVI